MSLSLFIAEGNIGKLELKRVPVEGGEKPVLNLSVKFDIQRSSPEGEYVDRGFWADVAYWGKRAEPLYSLAKVGARILVIGDVVMQTWESTQADRVGQLEQRMAVTARNIGLSPLAVESVQWKSRKGSAESDHPTGNRLTEDNPAENA